MGSILLAAGCQNNIFQPQNTATSTALREIPAVRFNFKYEADVPGPSVEPSKAAEERNPAVQSDFDANRTMETLDRTLASPDKKRVAAIYHRVTDMAAEYRLDIMPEDLGVKNVSYAGPRGTSAEKVASFLRTLETLEPGKTYMFVDHPGLDSAEMRAIHHIGYENVAVDRQGVTDTWTSPQVKDVIRTRKIQLIGYRDLVP